MIGAWPDQSNRKEHGFRDDSVAITPQKLHRWIKGGHLHGEHHDWSSGRRREDPASCACGGQRRSLEEEARLILREAVGREAEPKNLAAFIHECFAPYRGVELELPLRAAMREPPRLD
ncbi:MAG: hypothetical protein OXH79_21160 [Boseongicola sp.]|nr:hypothetical protein [Boseongicola sp.]